MKILYRDSSVTRACWRLSRYASWDIIIVFHLRLIPCVVVFIRRYNHKLYYRVIPWIIVIQLIFKLISCILALLQGLFMYHQFYFKFKPCITSFFTRRSRYHKLYFNLKSCITSFITRSCITRFISSLNYASVIFC